MIAICMDAEELHREVSRKVFSCCRDRRIDCEGLAQEITMECILQNKKPYYTFVKNRVIDQIRKEKVRGSGLKVSLNEAIDVVSPKEHPPYADLVEILIDGTDLSIFQKRLIYEHFYEGRSLGEISHNLTYPLHKVAAELKEAIDLLKETARLKGLNDEWI